MLKWLKWLIAEKELTQLWALKTRLHQLNDWCNARYPLIGYAARWALGPHNYPGTQKIFDGDISSFRERLCGEAGNQKYTHEQLAWRLTYLEDLLIEHIQDFENPGADWDEMDWHNRAVAAVEYRLANGTSVPDNPNPPPPPPRPNARCNAGGARNNCGCPDCKKTKGLAIYDSQGRRYTEEQIAQIQREIQREIERKFEELPK